MAFRAWCRGLNAAVRHHKHATIISRTCVVAFRGHHIHVDNPSTSKFYAQHHLHYHISEMRRRLFSSLPPLSKRKPSCPFRTLNIPKDAKYSHAKKAFLQIAMKHHPDTVGNDCEKTRQKSQDIFMRCRSALESIVECETTGKCLLRADVEEVKARTMSDEEFDSWFQEETGHQSPFQFKIDPATMREVASMHDDMAGSHGLDRDGGMWHLASIINSAVKQGKEGAKDVLKLEAGNVKDEPEAKGKLERRRKRVRGRR